MARMIPIGSPDDPRVAEYLALRDRDLLGRPGRFVAEGEVVVGTLLSERSRFRAESVLLAEGRAGALARIEARARPDLPVYLAAQPVMDAVVGFAIHRGILAIGRREPEADAGAVLPPAGRAALVVGLVGLANHDNVGGIFRNAAAFGADAVLLDRASCDPLYRKAIRVSTGAALTVPFARIGSGAAMVDRLAEEGFAVFALSPSGSLAVEEVAWPGRVALLVGSEGPGLPPGLLARTRSVRIGMAPGHDSLNVATATGIALHAAAKLTRVPDGLT